jgi:hypothetical protein
MLLLGFLVVLLLLGLLIVLFLGYSCCLHEVELLLAQGGIIVGARWSYWLTFQGKSTFFSNLINIFFLFFFPLFVYVVFFHDHYLPTNCKKII